MDILLFLTIVTAGITVVLIALIIDISIMEIANYLSRRKELNCKRDD